MKKLLIGLLVFGSSASLASEFEVTSVSGRLYERFEYPTNPQMYNGCPMILIATYAETARQQRKGFTSKEILDLDLGKNNSKCLYNSKYKISSFNDYVVAEKLE
jgi:hypothetical protein